MMLKTVLLIGGPAKGTRFRPLSMDIPKPLFPVAGFPMIYHHIEAASQVNGMAEVIIMGSYQLSDTLNRFIQKMQQEFKILVRYLQEYTALGTGGGMFHFRDQILTGNPSYFFVMNCDVCCDFPLADMLEFHTSLPDCDKKFTILGTEATRQQAVNYGSIVENKDTHEVLHYVEKPQTFVSSIINCGIYLMSPDIFQHLSTAFRLNQEDIRYDEVRNSFDLEVNHLNRDAVSMEKDVFADRLANSGKLFVYHTNKFWSQIKSPSAAVYANRHYLNIYHRTHPERLAVNGDGKPKIIGDVFIHHTASVHPSATLGPNVTIGKNVTVGKGVRVREAIALEGAVLQDHSCILHSIVGWHVTVGQWTRVEGTPNDPNPNKPFAKLDVVDTFNTDGRLNPSITVIGAHVQVPSEVIILNSIVLPNKDLDRSCKNRIIL